MNKSKYDTLLEQAGIGPWEDNGAYLSRKYLKPWDGIEWLASWLSNQGRYELWHNTNDYGFIDDQVPDGFEGMEEVRNYIDQQLLGMLMTTTQQPVSCPECKNNPQGILLATQWHPCSLCGVNQ